MHGTNPRIVHRPLNHLRILYSTAWLCALAVPLISAEGSNAKAAISDYRIVARDQIKFQISGEADEALLQRVSSGGEISTPLLGAVKVSGLTLRETENLLEK